MGLFLLEYVTTAQGRDQVEPLFDTVATAVQEAGGEVIEVQAATDLQRVYVIAEHDDQAALTKALQAADTAPNEVAPVRLVGATLDQVKASKGSAEYLVEWDLPKDLTMETYLERKKTKSPLYANVPEVAFLRTYVREDMIKCLCFYDAPDEDAVRRAREAVSTPFDRMTRLGGVPHEVR